MIGSISASEWGSLIGHVNRKKDWVPFDPAISCIPLEGESEEKETWGWRAEIRKTRAYNLIDTNHHPPCYHMTNTFSRENSSFPSFSSEGSSKTFHRKQCEFITWNGAHFLLFPMSLFWAGTFFETPASLLWALFRYGSTPTIFTNFFWPVKGRVLQITFKLGNLQLSQTIDVGGGLWRSYNKEGMS